jgi:hypothetical protein
LINFKGGYSACTTHKLAGYMAFIMLSIQIAAIYEGENSHSAIHSSFHVSSLAGWFNRNECEIVSRDESAVAVGDIIVSFPNYIC